MPARQTTETPLAPALEAIATAAANRVRAQAEASGDDGELQRRVAEAASAAIASGAALGAIASAEQVGHARARGELGPGALKRIARASRRRREADAEYEQEIVRGARLGLTHREIATAAEIAHGTVRVILARSDASTSEPAHAPEPMSANGREADHG
jgi:DNA-binding NarL/FixJ family response regulator